MADKYWKLLIAIFVVVASQAVLFVGMMLGAGAEFMGVVSVYGGLIGIVVGIILGAGCIINARGDRPKL